MKYIQEQEKPSGCVFCMAAHAADDAEQLVFYRGKYAFLILNRYPYTSGHVMCVPYAHENRLQKLTRDTRVEMMELTSRAVDTLQEVYQPDGFNVGLNLGEMAGAGIADHLHMHIVPRWGGDTNFMTSVGNTRVLPENLEDTFRRVKQMWLEFDRD